jgi:RNA polymerase sigma factor (sigma-70 family)
LRQFGKQIPRAETNRMAELTTTQQLQNILDRLVAGDDRAKAELIGRSQHRLEIIARRLLNSFQRVRCEEETLGVLNQAYLKLHTAVDEVKPRTVRQFMALASLEIRRVLLDYVRKLRGRGKNPRPDMIQISKMDGDTKKGQFDPPDPSIDPARLDLVNDLLEAISHLPHDECEAVDLLFLHGYTQSEASELLGVHKDTVKSRWSHARVKLAGKLAAFDAKS